MAEMSEEIRERVYAGVLGKLIGVYLGTRRGGLELPGDPGTLRRDRQLRPTTRWACR